MTMVARVENVRPPREEAKISFSPVRNTVALEIGISPSRSIASPRRGGRRDEGERGGAEGGGDGGGRGISVVAVKSGGKWEIQRPGDKWLITMVVERWLASSRVPAVLGGKGGGRGGRPSPG